MIFPYSSVCVFFFPIIPKHLPFMVTYCSFVASNRSSETYCTFHFVFSFPFVSFSLSVLLSLLFSHLFAGYCFFFSFQFLLFHSSFFVRKVFDFSIVWISFLFSWIFFCFSIGQLPFYFALVCSSMLSCKDGGSFSLLNNFELALLCMHAFNKVSALESVCDEIVSSV